MNVNLTLFIQVLIFVSFIMLIMQYVWPMFEKVLDDRSAEIAKSLEDAERARYQLHQADETVKSLLKEARTNAKDIIDEAKKHAQVVVLEAKKDAEAKHNQIVEDSYAEIEVQRTQLKEQLMSEVGGYALEIAQRVIAKKLDAKLDSKMIEAELKEVS
ncbi:MAG: F0F1 ATP synthase subunit B [Pseudomonadota bacterium]|nr:F0F1 ATP synthase subunit B [Pseudomonadota bacterium]